MEEITGAGRAPLVVERMPDKTRYRPGERVSYGGARFSLGGEDVTGRVSYSLAEGEEWRVSWRDVGVTATYADASGGVHAAELRLVRRRRVWPAALLALLALALAAAAAGLLWWQSQPRGDTGSYIVPQGQMSDEEAVELLNRQVDESRITVSVAPRMQLSGGRLRVNMYVPEPNNGLSERLEVWQGGELVCSSGVVPPGNLLEWLDAPGARAGAATATVRAVAEGGGDSGNPVSAEVEIVDG